MNLIKPKVELWSEEGVTPEEHIARCARVCYGHEGKGKDPKRLVQSLVNSGHVSMLRHATKYFMVTNSTNVDFDKSPFGFLMGNFYSHSINCDDNEVGWTEEYASTNYNVLYDQDVMEYDGDDVATIEEILDICKDKPWLFEKIVRLTFCLTTQISTSRELNRVSPNNIAERSTRYCSSKDGLEICKPWWYDEDYFHTKDGETYEEGLKRVEIHRAYRTSLYQAEKSYKDMLDLGMKPEDARGVLPLDTATKVVYTYSVAEWKHIIDLRYYGKTGKPHPNAKLIIGMVRDKINDFALSHGINYQL